MQVPPRHCLSFSQHGSRIPPAWETQETKAKAAMPFVTQAWKSYSVTYTVLCWSQRPALSQCGRREHTSMSPRRQGSSASHRRPATIMHLTKAQQVMIDALLLLHTTTQVQISITVLQLFTTACPSSCIQPLSSRDLSPISSLPKKNYLARLAIFLKCLSVLLKANIILLSLGVLNLPLYFQMKLRLITNLNLENSHWPNPGVLNLCSEIYPESSTRLHICTHAHLERESAAFIRSSKGPFVTFFRVPIKSSSHCVFSVKGNALLSYIISPSVQKNTSWPALW